MTTPQRDNHSPSRTNRLGLRTGTRAQLLSAACMWLIGSSVLLVRGVVYVSTGYWHAWALAIGLALGVIKSRILLEGVATKAVARIRDRGRAFFLSFFSLRSWALVAVMMGGGITLRHAFPNPGATAVGVLGAIYIGVGTALLLADRVFWHAALRRPRTTPAT